MYYEEKLINGKLMCRGTPDSEWSEVPLSTLLARIGRLEVRGRELSEALAPFAMQADSMQVLADDQKVCGIDVRHFRKAARILQVFPA